jgi:hypothetical protein
MSMRRAFILFLVGTIPLVSGAQVSGWAWRSGDYAYAQQEAGWVYYPAYGTAWKYNYGTARWTQAGAGWEWFQWPYVYAAQAGAWLYVQAPASGIPVYHFNTRSWTYLGDSVDLNIRDRAWDPNRPDLSVGWCGEACV